MGAYERQGPSPTDLYVNRLGSASDADGTPHKPFPTVQMALNAAEPGLLVTIHIHAGPIVNGQNQGYNERPRITGKVRLVNWNNEGQARIEAP
jgi:hypothetical protein